MPEKNAALTKKTFVLDTNVILHDCSCIHQFGENDVVIPIVVIEELDRFKRGEEEINRNAREFTRSLDALVGDRVFNGGVSLGKGKGIIKICLDRDFHRKLIGNFATNKPDNHILNAAYCISEERSGTETVLVTKDVNLRMKAKSIGLLSHDYGSDQVDYPDKIYKGSRLAGMVSEEAIECLFCRPFCVNADRLGLDTPLLANEFLYLKNGSKSALGIYNAHKHVVQRLESQACCNIRPRNVEQYFAAYALLNGSLPLVTLTGKAGTGKTLLALAAALERKSQYRQIFIARPTVPLSNKDLGFLPGDIHSKLDPYMQPLYDNLSVIDNSQPAKTGNGARGIKNLLEEEKIVVSPLSYIRGRSIVKVYFIVDEAQNLTPHEVKTIITRAGEGTKVVLTGDLCQIDHPYLDSRSNGLSYLIEKMKGQSLYAHVNLEKGERSELSDLAIKLL